MQMHYTFDDITLVPQYTTLRSREEADTSCRLGSFQLRGPIISANMDTITGPKMCVSLWNKGVVGSLHRFMAIDENVRQYRWIQKRRANCLVSIGIKEDDKDRASQLFEAGARHFIIDIAHGHSIQMKEAIGWLRQTFGKELFIIAGNVATEDGVRDLASWGANCVKVGVGGGSVCQTRIVTGHGVPMFSCLRECGRAAFESNVTMIADGGIRTSGDIVKAIVAGAHYVMLGSMFAGAFETPGDIVYDKSGNAIGKSYRGMASREAYDDYLSDRNTMPAPEGITTVVPLKPVVGEIVTEILGGIRSGMSYSNARTLAELRGNGRWIVQTANGAREARPHIKE